MGLLRPSRISKTDRPSAIIVLILAVLSILMVGSTTISEDGFWTRYTFVQLGSFLIGTVLVLFLVSMDYRVFDGSIRLLYILSIVLLLTVYIPGLGLSQYGARSWINLRFTTVQPSEIVKILYTLILADYLEKHHDDLFQFSGLVKAGLLAAPIIAIVLKEDLGSALAFMTIWLAMVFFAGLSLKVFAKFLAIVCALVPLAYLFMASYQKERISAFLHPNNLSLTGNYQVYESKIAIGSGGLLGKGLFHGMQKELSFIPVQQSDFIFSVIAEELGMIGGIIVIALFSILLLRFMKIAIESKDLYGALIVSGFTGMFFFQVFENIAMTIGLMPVTGITLPFVSYGGSSILSNMMAFGLIMSVRASSRELSF
ncbi:MAG: rod shape-determining protein RodA [Eubacteriales bacterium]|nr:rod shape-determining protein RodA [Eubacteriales bacterium]